MTKPIVSSVSISGVRDCLFPDRDGAARIIRDIRRHGGNSHRRVIPGTLPGQPTCTRIYLAVAGVHTIVTLQHPKA